MQHYIKEVIPPRPMNNFECNVLRHILSYEFHGQGELKHQAEGARVKVECETCPTVEFVVDSSHPKANVKYRIPIEAVGEDTDGVRIHFLVHVVDGYLYKLEIFREDSEPILKMPEIDLLSVF